MATKISPTPLMDQLWYTAVLDTVFYAELQAALGALLHYRPGGALEQDKRHNRPAAMKGLYKSFFSIDLLDVQPLAHNPVPYLKLAPPLDVFAFSRNFKVNLPSKRIIFVEAWGRAKMVPRLAGRDLRLRHEGRKMSPELTLDDNNIDVGAKRQNTSAGANTIHDQTSPSTAHDDLTKTYLRLLPNTAALEFLRSSTFSETLQTIGLAVASSNGCTIDECIEEFRRFIAIKAFTSDEIATKISPTPLMDEIWHAAILDTRFYVKLQEALGITIHYQPGGATEWENKQMRLAAMEATYKTFFKTEPVTSRAGSTVKGSRLPDPGSKPGCVDTGAGGSDDEPALFPITVFIKTFFRPTFEVHTDKYATVADIKVGIQDRLGWAPDFQILIFRGRRMYSGLAEYGNKHDHILGCRISQATPKRNTTWCDGGRVEYNRTAAYHGLSNRDAVHVLVEHNGC
ncbi:hypothetical protein IFR05_003157 [Cadophora sp. M221]|nr:hypothetical protein IFR05_003157 [Cadophora sp. M221]